MTLEDFESVARQSSGRCNQFALGGRGDPDQHEHFEDILKICRQYNVVPNFTTSGFGMTPEIAALCKEYCGAVAVSWYRKANCYEKKQVPVDVGDCILRQDGKEDDMKIRTDFVTNSSSSNFIVQCQKTRGTV